MSDEDWGFAAPPFKGADALLALKRTLRELGLAERAGGFELRGRRLVELAADDTQISVRLARKPALTPEWDTLTLRSHAERGRCVDEIKRRLRRWEDAE